MQRQKQKQQQQQQQQQDILGQDQQQAVKILEEINSSSNFSPQIALQRRAYGCIIGSFVADSLGSYLEFYTKKITSREMDMCMKQPGGGWFQVKIGQITDDSEMALSLAYALIESKDLDIDIIAKHYGLWYYSEPFDMGITVRQSLEVFQKVIPLEDWDSQTCRKKYQLASSMIKSSKQQNKKSQSNGCLMRLAPLAVYLSQIKDQNQIVKAVKLEVSLTHPDNIIAEACVAWVIALVEIIQTGNHSKAFEKAYKYIMDEQEEKVLQEEWFEALVLNDNFMPANKNIGWGKIAWSYGFIYLKNWERYESDPIAFYNIMKEVIQRGGDTDTNACIVAQIVGTLVGPKNIPNKYIENLLECQVQDGCKQKRFEKFNPYNSIIVTQQLLKIAPKKLNIIQ